MIRPGGVCGLGGRGFESRPFGRASLTVPHVVLGQDGFRRDRCGGPRSLQAMQRPVLGQCADRQRWLVLGDRHAGRVVERRPGHIHLHVQRPISWPHQRRPVAGRLACTARTSPTATDLASAARATTRPGGRRSPEPRSNGAHTSRPPCAAATAPCWSACRLDRRRPALSRARHTQGAVAIVAALRREPASKPVRLQLVEVLGRYSAPVSSGAVSWLRWDLTSNLIAALASP